MTNHCLLCDATRELVFTIGGAGPLCLECLAWIMDDPGKNEKDAMRAALRHLIAQLDARGSDE